MMDKAKLATKSLKAAEKLRSKAGLTFTAIADPIEIALVQCGCKVIFQSLPTLEGIYSSDDPPTIIIGSQRPPGRQIFTCAHELGHHIFGHGTQIDQLDGPGSASFEEEFLANTFAGYLLMPKLAVTKALRERKIISTSSLSCESVYKLANYFGVSYGAFVTHIRYALRLIPGVDSDRLLRVQPKSIKSIFGIPPGATPYFVDHFWRGRSVDMAVEDYLLIPKHCNFEANDILQSVEITDSYLIGKAVASGYTRAFDTRCDWAVNVRISRRQYEGLARYRFMKEE